MSDIPPQDKWVKFDENTEQSEKFGKNQNDIKKDAVEENQNEESLLTDDHEVESSPEVQKYNELEERYTKAQDEALRLRAEMENVRRRAQSEVVDAHKYAAQKFAENMLSVLDSFDGALQAPAPASSEGQQLLNGLKMTQDIFLKALEKSGVKEIAPAIGEPFNPALHEAMSMRQDPHSSPNSVLQLLRKGYEINGRVIRAAMIIVNQ